MFIFLLFAGLASCDKALLSEDPAADPVAVFEACWKELDQGYAFFAYKQIDWDSVYQEFRPQVHDGMSSVDLFNLLSDMLYSLRDGHVNLTAPFNFTRNWEWYLGYPANFDYDLLERHYWNDEQWYTGPLVHTWLDSTIGYVRYASFGSSVSESQLDLVVARFKEAKGLIIDVRDNGGGSLNRAYFLASRFADQKRLAYRFVVKDGPGHTDFSEPYEVPVEPEGPQQFTNPVIILTNRSSYSATNSFVAVMKAFPHVKVVGDWTGGGGGIPSSVELPNGWMVRYSASQSFLPDGFNIEGGIPPDIRVDMNPEDALHGKDSILERALEELKE